MEKKKRSGFWEKLAHKKLREVDGQQSPENLCTLSTEEQKRLKNIRIRTLIIAGLTGAMGVLFLSIPHMIWGQQLFPVHQIWIPLLDTYMGVEIEYLTYGLVLLIIELWILTYINIIAVRKIADACGFPGNIKNRKDEGVDDLVAVSLNKKQTALKNIGINPYEGLSKFSVLLFQIVIRLKAAFTNILAKILIKRLLGRYAIRYVLDFVGIPVYAFWNMYGAHRVMKEARVRVMAPPIIDRFIQHLYEEQKHNAEFTTAIYDTLQTVSKTKRSFHFNHYLLAINFLKKFDVPISTEPKFDDAFLHKIQSYSPQTQKAIAKLLVMGIIIDGHLSFIEKKALKKLDQSNVLPYKMEQIKKWTHDFYQGEGIETLIKS